MWRHRSAKERQAVGSCATGRCGRRRCYRLLVLAVDYEVCRLPTRGRDRGLLPTGGSEWSRGETPSLVYEAEEGGTSFTGDVNERERWYPRAAAKGEDGVLWVQPTTGTGSKGVRD